MNQHLKTLLNFIQQSKDLSASERNKILGEVKKIEDEILHKSRELEIEAALEKVRAVAMNMKEPAGMLEICRITSQQLQILKVKEIRNIQTAVFYESKNIYLNYEYFTNPDKTTITEVDFNSHPDVAAFANQMLKAPDTFFTKTFTGKEVKDWIKYQEKANQFIDPKQYKANSIHYYFYSIGSCALGVSTYVALTSEEIILFKRFRNVFELSYRRYTDIEKAQEQAREAKIEAALERTRTHSMLMQHSDEITKVSNAFHEQLLLLGIPTEFSYVWLPDEAKQEHQFWATWGEEEKGTTIYKSKAVTYPLDKTEPYTAICFAAWQSDKRFLMEYIAPFEVKDWFSAWEKWMRGAMNLKPELFPEGLYYAEAYMNYGCFGINIRRSLSGDEQQILSRFTIEFERAYTRFLDLQKAEAQTREAKIEAALERVRSRTMAMQKSDELPETSLLLFRQFKELGETAAQISISIVNEEEGVVELSATLHGKKLQQTFKIEMDEPFVMKKAIVAWKAQQKSLVVELSGKDLHDYNIYRNSLSDIQFNSNHESADDRWIIHLAFFSKGMLSFSSDVLHSIETIQLLERFAGVFDLTYTRFLDLKHAEAQAREAKIEAALERVRSKAMAMHKSDDLNAAVAIVFEELDKLNLGMLRCGIGILSKEKRCADVWTTTIAEQGRVVQVSGDESMDIHPLLQGAFDAWLRQGDFSCVLEGDNMSNYYSAVMKTNFHLPESQIMVEHAKELKHYYYGTAFESGMLFAFRETDFTDEAKAVMKRFAGVFNLTYKRFLDIQKAEAQAIEAQLQKQLIETKHREITENISYALRIQTAILPDEKLVKEYLQNSFVLYLPKDVVAGDFYWMLRLENMILFSANDCTGHGVSGAMVSVFCHNALNRAIREYNLTQPSLILDKVAELVEENFTQSEDKIQDGMDTSLCAYFPQQHKLQWAGANNPLWIVRNNELFEYKPDKQPIGKYENRKPYTNHEIELQQSDNIYIFSDGYQDQFGGERGKKLTKKGLKNILLSIREKNMEAQYEALLNYHYEWKGKEEQVDDICILGVKI